MEIRKDFSTSEDFDYETIRRSYSGTSFVPERRATDEIAMHINWLNIEAEKFRGMCTNDDQCQYVEEQLAVFKTRYLDHARRITAARSNCISTMIAGPSNFPVRRAEKANASERRRCEEFDVWVTKARAAIAKGIAARKTAEQVTEESMDAVKKMISRSHLDNPLGRQNCYSRLQTWAKHNSPEMVREALDFLKTWQDEHLAGKGFTVRHKVWALTGMEPVALKESVEEVHGDIRILTNTDVDRVQIIFPGKPDSETICKLKRRGWRWSPRNGAWQRQITSNALACAREIVAAAQTGA